MTWYLPFKISIAKTDVFAIECLDQRKSDPFNMPIGPILRQILNKITRFSKRFLWLKFRKILKNQPIHIQNFAFYKGSFMYQEADFAAMLVVHPRRDLLYLVPLGCTN